MKKSILGGIAFFLFSSFVHAQGVNEKFATAFTTYTINQSKCNKIEHSSGSIIYVPDFAFDCADYNVQIKYREFLTPLDMLVNGIPMTTNLNGKETQLESNGMFEIQAFQNGKPVSLYQNKKVEVRLAFEEPMKENTSAYKLESGQERWDNIPAKVNELNLGGNDDLWGSSPVTNEDEIELEYGWDDGWCDGCEEDFQQFARADSIKNVRFQAMEIDQMGFYNYDHPVENVEFVPIVAQFSVNGEPVNSTVYVVYDDINSVFYYPSYTWENQFAIIKGKSYKLFTMDTEGQVAKIEQKPNLQVVSGKTYQFNLKMDQEIPSTKEALASTLGIE